MTPTTAVRSVRLALAASVAVLSLTLLSGCPKKDKRANISGRLLLNGAKYAVKLDGKPLPPGDPGLRVDFIELTSDGKTGQSMGAAVNAAEGTFTVGGGSHNPGLKPGKYRIAVAAGAYGTPDQFQKAFSPETSPLTVTIPDNASSVKLAVDLGAKTVTLE